MEQETRLPHPIFWGGVGGWGVGGCVFVVKTKSMWCWGERESSENKVHMVYSLKLRVHFSRKQREGMILSFLFATVFFFLLFFKINLHVFHL